VSSLCWVSCILVCWYISSLNSFRDLFIIIIINVIQKSAFYMVHLQIIHLQVVSKFPTSFRLVAMSVSFHPVRILKHSKNFDDIFSLFDIMPECD